MKKQLIVLVITCLNAISLSQTKSENNWFESARAKYNINDYQGAIADYTKAISLKPDDADAYEFRGLAKGQLNDFQGAIADFTKAISLQPDNADAYFNRAVAYLKVGQKSKALPNFMKAIELGYRVPQEYLDLCK